MDAITFTCKIITPMFLHGADGQTPELRAPSIKGAMRFWWRAVNGHLPLEELRRRETDIFGGVGKGESDGRRSKLLIRIGLPQTLETFTTSLVPHKRNRKGNHTMLAEAFKPRSVFQVHLSRLPTCPLNVDEVQALFQLMITLGGLGKRVRRGMGSMCITHVDNKAVSVPDIDSIYKILTTLSPNYSKKGDHIVHTYSGRMEQYPWIYEITTGKKQDNLLEIISRTTHDLKKPIGKEEDLSDKEKKERIRKIRKYEHEMGYAKGKERFASPVFTSCILEKDSIIPVFTTLHTVSRDGFISKPGQKFSTQTQFKKSLS